MAECDQIFVGDLPADFDDAKLSAIFGAYGTIAYSKVLAPGTRGTRAALIQFGSVAEAKWMVENLNGNIPQGLDSAISVRFKDQKGAPKGGGKGDKGFKGGDKGGDWGLSWSASWGGKSGGEKAEASPGTAVFIGNLPGSLDDATLHSVFGAYGTISKASLLQVNSVGQRAAIVEFSTKQEAQWIVENLNGNLPEGLTGTDKIVVSFKQEKKGAKGDAGGWGGNDWGKGGSDWGKGPYGKGGKGDGKGKGGCGIKTLVDGLMDSGAMPGGVKYSNDENALFVGGLPWDTTDVDLFWIFSPFGAIAPRGVKAMMTPDHSGCKGIGFVNFLDPNASTMAISTLNGTQMPDGSTLTVSQKRQGGGGGDGEKGKSKGKW